MNPDTRWEIVDRLLHDDHLALTDRVAGCLVLLYAQQLTRIIALTVDQVITTDDGVYLKLGASQTIIPEPLGALLVDLATNGRSAHRCRITRPQPLAVPRPPPRTSPRPQRTRPTPPPPRHPHQARPPGRSHAPRQPTPRRRPSRDPPPPAHHRRPLGGRGRRRLEQLRRPKYPGTR